MKNSVRFRRGQLVRDPGSEGIADVEVRSATVDVRIGDETRRIEVKIRQKNGGVLTLSVFCRDRLATPERK
jgi:hypothetical protein